MLSRLPRSAALIRVQSWSRDASPPEAFERLLEIDWPSRVGDVAQGALDVICVGPTDWLLVSKSELDADRLLHAVNDTLQDSTFRATDFSSALVRILIEGTAAPALIAKACALDVYSLNLAPGRASRTLIAGLPVIVRCREPTVFECIAPRSYEDYLLSWLTDASTEFTRTN